MIRSSSSIRAGVPAAVLLTLLGCEAKKSENPLSPSVAGPIAGVEITTPQLIEPAQGFRFRENQQPIRLVIQNSTTNGVRAISYGFEVASDSEFQTIVFARNGVPPGDGGRTSVQLDTLELGRSYYWRARANDGANSSSYATAGFEVLPRAIFTPPAAISPTNNEQVSTRTPVLRLNNSQKNVTVGSVTYFFVVAKDQAFTQIVAYADVGEGGGTTSWTVNRELDYGATHFWRARGTDGENFTEWSAPAVFRAPPAPSGGGGGGGGGGGPVNPGGPCNSTNPDTIVKCERAKYGFMSSSQIVAFLRASAQSLNRNGIGGGPYGILRKDSGHQCNGYSCDILCAGQGTGQRQVDVLGDADGAQQAGWGGTRTWPDIRVDVCEIQ